MKKLRRGKPELPVLKIPEAYNAEARALVRHNLTARRSLLDYADIANLAIRVQRVPIEHLLGDKQPVICAHRQRSNPG
jgi:hypothetical protein